MTTVGSPSRQGQEGVSMNPDGRPKVPMIPADVQALAMGRRKHEKSLADEKKAMREIEVAVCQARRNGAPIKQIAELAGLTRNTVYKMLERNGLHESPGDVSS